MSLIGHDKIRAQHNGFLCQSVYLKQRRANHLDFHITAIESQKISNHLNLLFFVWSKSPSWMHYRQPLRKFACLVGYGMKSMGLIFKIEH